MSLLHKLVKEMAAAGSTGAHSIATTPGSLFDGGVVDLKKKKRKMLRRVITVKEGLGVSSDSNNFDSSDVISKIAAAAKQANLDDDTQPFGLEDENGNIVKVYVRNSQAEDFEKQLSVMLAGDNNNDGDDEPSSLEIAEILFKLKDTFDIVNVEWPGIEGDVEEEQEVVDDETVGDAASMGDGTNMEDGLNAEDKINDGGVPTDAAPDTAAAETALSQVIDMMKSDAEAKMAEANARTAEARAKEAEYTAQANSAKVRKEEQIYDMENAEKEAKDRKKEADTMAKLARYQHQQAQDAEVKLSMESKEDETPRISMPTKINDDDQQNADITLNELTALILRNLGHN